MRGLACVALALAIPLATAACGGTSASSASGASSTTPSGPAPATLPWEAAMTVGATFTLVDGMMADAPEDEAGEPLTIKVTNVEDRGSERVYTLAWSDAGNGLEKIVVRGDGVVFNETPRDRMQDPFETPVGMCYGEDLSNPEGCDDVCDGHICMDETGIVTVSGLYAPGYSEYVAK